MATLHDILYKVSLRQVSGSIAVEVANLQTDSRLCTAGSCFIAIRGTVTDGHLFISKAVALGALVIICEELPSETVAGVTYVQVDNTAEAAGLMAHSFFGAVSEKMKVVGVTGTNGKTTIATLLYKLFSGLGYTCGLISTVQIHIGDAVEPATHTTPDALALNQLLRRMYDAGCTHVFMECSSHAIHQHRIAGIRFAGALFSNISHDHLDYHKTFDAYIQAKKVFFDGLTAEAFAISNLDDKRGTVMLQNCKALHFYYSLRSVADFKGRILENALSGLQLQINQHEVHFRLIGEFNAYNLLAVYGAAICLGADAEQVLQVLSNLSGAEGRFDYQVSPNEHILGIIDYAHTPDALENVLATIRRLRKGNEQVITIVGCGGDRDKTKRPLMGETACAGSDRVIFTSDNPRSEDPEAIIRDMETGLSSAARRKYIAIADRREAIKTAVMLAAGFDIILIAGKGHEKYQEVKGVKYDFDDKQVLTEMFTLLGK